MLALILLSSRYRLALSLKPFTFTMGKKINTQKSADKSQYVEASYRIEGNTRHVVPYVHEFKTFAKGRWLGRSILEVLLKEFGGHSVSYFRTAIANGLIRVNDNVVTVDYKFKNSDRMSHTTHRHEPPVVGAVSLVGENDDLIAVNKPVSTIVLYSNARIVFSF